MGGKGSGGRRPGSGPKPKITAVPSTNPPPSTNSDAGGAEPFEEFNAPDDLTADERRVWLRLAPHAFKRQTLTTATAFSFELLCRNIVLERSCANGEEAGNANHRGLIQRIDAELLRFDLSPNGKPHGASAADHEKPKSALDLMKERRKNLHAVR
jgi:hypothetical protein